MSATPRIALHVPGAELEPDPLPAEQVLSGSPSVSVRELWTAPGGAASCGIWEITPGVSTDVEADEVFVVISGRATIAFEGGETVETGPGDVVELRAGEKTTWTVHETLRKVYVVAG